MDGRHMAFPFHVGNDGRSAAPASLDDHVRGEIIQLILTNSGERPFLPRFGGGLRRMVFNRNDDVTAGMVKSVLAQNLSRWLGQRIDVDLLDVTADGSTLNVDLRYRVIATGETRQVRFQRQGGAP
jgi:phage baseplate assembly protein W